MSSLIVCPALFSFHSLGIFRSIVFAFGERAEEKAQENSDNAASKEKIN
jgi:hypothetical protein